MVDVDGINGSKVVAISCRQLSTCVLLVTPSSREEERRQGRGVSVGRDGVVGVVRVGDMGAAWMYKPATAGRVCARTQQLIGCGLQVSAPA